MLGAAPECQIYSSSAELLSQTTPHTCSAACAASLLRIHGVSATEAELAELCLTREGTHWLGVYRGLMLKTEGTDWTVEVESYSQDSLDRTGLQPGILCLNIDPSQLQNCVDHGFKEEVGHSVLYLGPTAGNGITVFDPAPDFGVESWGRQMLGGIRNGVILRIVPRDPDHRAPMLVTRNVMTRLVGRNLAARLVALQQI
jgi:hypothetical protein